MHLKLIFDQWLYTKPRKIFALALGAAILVFSIYLMYMATITDKKVFSLGLVTLFAGVLLESLRTLKDWKMVVSIFGVAYVLSLLPFVPGNGQLAENLQENIHNWPYLFVAAYMFCFLVMYHDKPTERLTEGTTLLQSLSLIYWIIDYNFIHFGDKLTITLLAIVLSFSVFSLFCALTHFRLSDTMRLILSVWSSIAMLTLAADNIIRVIERSEAEASACLSEEFSIGLQYFFLGTSAIYICHNMMLLVGFLPGKNVKYADTLRETKEKHLSRYSKEQVFAGHAFLCVLYALLIFGLNYQFQILPRHTAIWFVFLSFPLLINIMTTYKNDTGSISPIL
jgi:hypothetical protein